MTVTISFRVREELEEFLEQEAERRMTTKSAVARDYLAERVREEMEADKAEANSNASSSESNSSEQDLSKAVIEAAFATNKIGTHNGKTGDYKVVDNENRDHRYYNTREGAARRYIELYGWPK